MLTAVNEYIIQGIGFVGVALFIISYQIINQIVPCFFVKC